MLSLKSFVKAIMSPLAVFGAYSRRSNALSLQQYLHPGATREQYHQPVPVLTKIDPITGTEINTQLLEAGTRGFQSMPCGLSGQLIRDSGAIA
jgi:hypothetical protein